jgi:hypothetical protein
MAGALILTILPVMLIMAALFLISGHLDPGAAVGLAAVLGLVVVVFVGLLRAAVRQQPSRAMGDRNHPEDPPEEEEQARERQAAVVRLRAELRASEAARDVRHAEDAITRWDDEGGSARP